MPAPFGILYPITTIPGSTMELAAGSLSGVFPTMLTRIGFSVLDTGITRTYIAVTMAIIMDIMRAEVAVGGMVDTTVQEMTMAPGGIITTRVIKVATRGAVLPGTAARQW